MTRVTRQEVVSSLEKERLLIELKEMVLSLSERQDTHPTEISQAIHSVFPSFSPGTEEDVLAIPVGVFASDCTPLQALVSFLHEQKRYSLKEIALLIDRTYRSVSQAYREGVVKEDLLDDFLIPLNMFSANLSILEAVIRYLHVDCSLTFSRIASFLKKDQRTIWTIWDRAQKKMHGEGRA